MSDVLIVDDDPSIRELLGVHLDLAKYTFREAVNGEEALRMMNEKVPDVVVLDIMMPVVDGLETCRRIRANPKLATSYVIILSAKDTVPDKVEGLDIGADAYLTKPFEPEELLAQIRVGFRIFWERQSAMAEPLTGLFNRRTFDVLLAMEMARAERFSHPVSMAIFDIDDFSTYTSRLDPQDSDRLIQEVAAVLTETAGQGDMTSHWVGERFGWLQPGSDLKSAMTAAEQLRAAVAGHQFSGAQGLSVSVGVTQLMPDDTPNIFMGRAADALEAAKEKGSNSVASIP